MAKRFHTVSFPTVSGQSYVVEIWDTSFSGTSVQFEPGPDIFTLSYAGEMRSSPVWVQSSEVRFNMHITDATLQAFVDDMTNAQEGRFQIKITKGGTFWWCGNVITDNSNYPDLESYTIEVRATDGLGSLGNVDFNNSGTAYSGTETFIGIVQKCLSKTGLLDFGWAAGATAIRTADNWYEDSMSTGAANDPLNLSRTNHYAFYDIDDNAVETFMSAYDVLEEVLRAKNLVLKQSAGAFRLYQYGELAAASLTNERRYDRDGAYLGASSAVDITKTLDQDAVTAVKENIVDFSWYPPLKRVELKYRAKNWRNHVIGQDWSSSDDSTYTLAASLDKNGGLATLRMLFDMSQSMQNVAYSDGDAVFVIYKLTIKTGAKYLRRQITGVSDYAVTYDLPAWVTAASYYYFHFPVSSNTIPAVGSTQPVDAGHLDITTPAMQDDGTTEVRVQFHDTRKQHDGASVSVSDLALTWSTEDALLQVSSSGNPVTDMTDMLYASTSDIANDLSEELAMESVVGDGTTPNSLGRIEVSNGSTWSDSVAWWIDGSGTKYALYTILTRRIMASRKNPVRRMSGDIWDTAGTMEAHHRIDDSSSSAVWIMTRADYNARMERWSGDFFYIADSITDITSITPQAIDPAPPVKLPSGTYQLPPAVPGTSISTQGIGLPPSVLANVLGGAQTSASLAIGAITSISVNDSLNTGAYTTGQSITVIDPVTGFSQNFTVAADTAAGDTSISVAGYASADFPPGSFILTSPQNATIEGYGSGTTGSSPTSSSQTSVWWDIFQQWWAEDDTNAIEWPIEAPNVVFETDENAGDGSTAGIRFDGDGLKSYTNASATATANVGTDGSFTFKTAPTAGDGSTAGVIISKSSGVIGYGASSVNPQNGFAADGSCLIRVNFNFETESAAGDGSTAGIRWDTTNGFNLYKNSTTKPVFTLKNDGRTLFNYDGHPTIASGIFYVNNGILYIDHDGAGTKVHPQLGHIKEMHVYDFATAWTAAANADGFWRVTADYVGYEIYKIGYSIGGTSGTGAGTNSFSLKHQDNLAATTTTLATVTAISGTTQSGTTTFTAQALADGDIMWVYINSVKSTPPQGLYLDIYLRKT